MTAPSAESWKLKGNDHFKSNKWSDALECYTRAIELDPNNHVLYGNRAQTLIKMNRLSEAEKDCDEAIRIKPDFLKAYFRKGLVYKMTSKWHEALSQFHKIIESDPNNKEARVQIQEIQELMKKHEVKSVKLNPTSIKKIIPIEIPSGLPQNSAEFELSWRDLGDAGSDKDDLRYQYLSKVGPELFGSLNPDLEPDMFSEILNALTYGHNTCDTSPGLPSKILDEISKSKRFDIISTFINPEEKNLLRNLISEESDDVKDDLGVKYQLM